MKTTLKKNIPDIIIDFVKTKRRIKAIKKQPIKDVFTNYKETKYWKSSESLSGDGSELSVTITLRKGLEKVLEEFKVETMLDIPCGDFNWMKMVKLSNV